jgi:hypothetical protein
MRDLLPNFAKATLCQQERQDQTAALWHRWYYRFEWCESPDGPHESGASHRDWGHDLRQDWKEVAARQPFRWEVNREHPRRYNHPSVMVESLKLREQARLDDLETAEREREEKAREAEREQAREAHQAREIRHEAAMGRMLAEQRAQAEENQRPMQQSEADNETLRKARQLHLEEEHRHATQTRAEAREQLRAEDRLGKEEKAKAAEEARRLEAERKDG